LKQVATADHPHGLKCGSFGASSLAVRHLATGDLGGQLQTIDLERPSQPVLRVQAHKGVVNGLDAFGGQVRLTNPPILLARLLGTCNRCPGAVEAFLRTAMQH